MDATTYVALSAQIALQKQLETVANNVSNADTAGFKADRPFFQSFVDQLKGPEGSVAFVEDAATYIDRGTGPIEVTGNSMDIAVDGNAYISVAAAQQTEYTKDGHLKVTPDGTLTDSAGRNVLGSDGAPIQIPQGFTNFEVKANGNIKVTVNGRVQDVAQIGLFRPNNPVAMRKAGDGALTAAAGVMEPVAADDNTVRVVQGSIEGSTVQPMKEIANMTELSRAYERLQSLLTNESDRENKMIDSLGHPAA